MSFDYSKIDTIKVSFIDTSRLSVIITDKDKIEALGNVLNDNYRNPMVYKALFIIELIDSSRREYLTCTDKAIDYNGVTYQLTEDISKCW